LPFRAAPAYDGPTESKADAKEPMIMRISRVARTAASLAPTKRAAPATASVGYALVDRANEVTYQGSLPPVDLSDEGVAAREALRAQGQQLIAMDTERCPPIDRGRNGAKSSTATVEEIVAGMRSAMPYGSAVAPTAPADTGIKLPQITVPRATGGGMSVGGPPSGMSIR
jgi:hypothetical protein